MVRYPPLDDRRQAAGLAVGALVFGYWLVAARPLFAMAAGSLVVAGERAYGPVGLDGALPDRLIPLVVAVELAVTLRAAVLGVPELGIVAGGLFLLAAWLTGPSLRARDGAEGDDATRCRRRGGMERDPAD